VYIDSSSVHMSNKERGSSSSSSSSSYYRSNGDVSSKGNAYNERLNRYVITITLPLTITLTLTLALTPGMTAQCARTPRNLL